MRNRFLKSNSALYPYLNEETWEPEQATSVYMWAKNRTWHLWQSLVSNSKDVIDFMMNIPNKDFWEINTAFNQIGTYAYYYMNIVSFLDVTNGLTFTDEYGYRAEFDFKKRLRIGGHVVMLMNWFWYYPLRMEEGVQEQIDAIEALDPKTDEEAIVQAFQNMNTKSDAPTIRQSVKKVVHRDRIEDAWTSFTTPDPPSHS